jgi:aspartate dehydrogenase
MDQNGIALIGFGAIGRTLAGLVAAEPDLRLAGVMVRERAIPEARALLPAGVPVVGDRGALLSTRPGLVVECAGQEALLTHAEGVLAAGVPLMVISTGALATPGLLERLTARGSAPLIVPAGAIAGLDGLGALKQAGLQDVTYTSTKPPLAWRGTPAERILDLETLRERTVFFEGNARDAALRYPKNANLAATVALAGLGFERTRVRLVADPAAVGNVGEIEAMSEIGTLSVTMAGRASANPKTSASVAYSLLHAIRSRGARLVI